jgi:molybdenum cofactor cytidylyltransferase
MVMPISREPSPERSGPVGAIVLAAGGSARMGQNKLLFPLSGETVLRRAVRRATEAGLEPVVVVLGHEAGRAQGELAGLGCRTVVNPDWEHGINRSLRTGLAALPAETTAAMVMLADMPFVTTEMLRTLVERWRDGTAPLVISDYDGVNSPPMLYGRALFPELLAMEGEGCGKQVVRRHREEATAVAWPAAALADLDVPEDYERVARVEALEREGSGVSELGEPRSGG